MVEYYLTSSQVTRPKTQEERTDNKTNKEYERLTNVSSTVEEWQINYVYTQKVDSEYYT